MGCDMNKLEELFMELERVTFSEEEVIEYFYKLYKQNLTDLDLVDAINTIFEERGYNVEFLTPVIKHKQFKLEEYIEVTNGVSRSKYKTLEFIKYLKEVNSHIVTMASLYLIKVRYLVDEALLKKSNPYIKKHYEANSDLRDLLFEGYLSDDKETKAAIKAIKENILTKLGGFGDDYNLYPYYEFIVDSEYLLYSLGDYMKTNTIKIMFKMANKEIFARLKNQYSLKLENTNKYLNLIDKKLVNWYLDKHKEEIDYYQNDGYVQFYRHLEVR